MLITTPVTVQVYSAGCDASLETIRQLEAQQTPHTVTHPTKHTRHMLARIGYDILPVVIIHRGQGDNRHRYMSWAGHHPAMLRRAHQLTEGRD